jgi:outer membrane protein OmpA-like peptidoglycan-associated protein
MRKMILLAALLCGPTALAQDSIDTHGFYLTPGDGDLLDPLRSWSSERHERALGLDLVGEYAYHPLIRHQEVDGLVTSQVEVEDLVALNIGAFYSPHDRLAIAVSAPAYLAIDRPDSVSNVGMGDIRVSAPVGLLVPDNGLSLSLVPHLDIPSPYDEDYLGLEAIGGGAVLAATVSDNRWQGSVNAGVQLSPEVDVINLVGGERLLTAASLGYALTDDFALRAEGIFNPTLTKNDVPWTDSPAELTLSGRGFGGHTMAWTAGVSTALSTGASAATYRAFLGMNWALGAREKDWALVYVPCEDCIVDVAVIPIDEDGNPIDEESMAALRLSDGARNTFTTGQTIMLPGPDSYVFFPECPEEPTLVVIEGDKIILMEPVYFDFNKSDIRFPESFNVLAALVKTLGDNQDLILVEAGGHTDERGSDEFNEGLSQRRMNAVVDWLVEHGVARDRLFAIGYGERELLNDDCDSSPGNMSSEDCHQLNRRVEFTILERAD